MSASSELQNVAPSSATSGGLARDEDPHIVYQRRLNERRQVVDGCQKRDSLIATARGIIFLAGVGILIAALNVPAVSAAWLVMPLLLFAMLVVVHGRVLRQLDQARRAVHYYERAVDRLAGRWSGTGPTGERYVDPSHPYAHDLDIFGNGSLFQLLSTARTRLGEDTLARWLSAPTDIATIHHRQSAVAELRNRLDLREELALLDAEVHHQLDQNQLLEWAQEPPQFISRERRLLSYLLAFAAVVALSGWLAFDWPLTPLAAVLTAEAIFTFAFREHLLYIVPPIERAGSGLTILAQVLEVIERQGDSAGCSRPDGASASPPESRGGSQSPELDRIAAALQTSGLSPSQQIARLSGLIRYLENSLKNQFFAPLAFFLGLPVHLIHAVECWRAEVGPHIGEWLAAVGDFEALSALAGFAYEHPDHPFPEIAEDVPLFDGREIGHPLLPEERCVRNDLSLGGELRLIMISGSNMSGKSTLLRTVGTNIVLALAGGPVRARSLTVSPCRIGTAMRVQDSLQAGVSLFYTSVSRLKQIVELADGDVPLLFLLDEILQGTNSHDRRVGAEAIIRQLVGRGAAGLVTTHDLALTDIVASFGPQAVNVHLEDQLVDGRMSFDYRLRPGVIRKSNALELMRMVGLEVEDHE